MQIKRDGQRATSSSQRHQQTSRSTCCRIIREPPEQHPSSSSSSIRAAEADWLPPSNMLRPLLCLSALIALTGTQTFTEVDISSCPITYYGQKYNRLYVTLTDENITICFTSFFSPETGGNCIVERSSGAATWTFPRTFDYETEILNRVECNFMLYFPSFNSPRTVLTLINFRTKEVLLLTKLNSGSVVYELQVNGTTVDTLNATAQFRDYLLDVFRCRYSGGQYEHGTVIRSDPETCSKLTCFETKVLLTSDCGPLERCQGNSICVFDTICTVTGPTVIDIHGQVNSIQDRCAYSLVSTPLIPDFHVLANFQERRRKDVSFLDSVTLRLDGPGVYIHLEQGGRVQLNDSTLTLNSSAQLVYGVELSKDQTGVTAKLSLSNLTVSVFFDGYTAQIHFTGPAVPSLEGLCGNSSRSLSELRLSEYSSTSCDFQYNDTADSTINCNNVTERCNLLKEAPFTSCNNDTDPQPYITACNNTLCKYPAVDGLNCQFLKAYARACSLQGNHTLEGWTSKTGCSPEAFCQNRTCSDHEFCGETVGGDTRCFCRPIFASKYRSTDSLGDPTVCSENSASLTLVGCLLEDKGIDYSALHLNDPTCRGQIDELTHMVTFSFNSSNSCGTVITTNNSQISYKNTIKTQNSSSDIITRQDQVYIDFSCVYTQPDIKTETFRIRDNSVSQHITSGAWNYTLTTKSFTDAGHTQAVESSTEVQLNHKIWVELKTDGLDGGTVVLVTDSCWATDQPSPTSSPRYNLIINGCANPADPTVEVEENGLGTSTYFSFNMFQFTGSSDNVYLHCKLHLCPNQENSCIPTCNGAARRRRSARATYEGEALISMAWTH